MLAERSVVDLIERAQDEDPYCPCGRHTVPVWRDGIVWLECSVLSEPVDGLLRRIVATVTAPVHVHRPIIHVAAATPSHPEATGRAGHGMTA